MPKLPRLAMKSYTIPKKQIGAPLPVPGVNKGGIPVPKGAPKIPTPGPPGPASAFSPGASGLYEQARINIAAGLKNTVGSINQQQDRAANDFGFKVEYDPRLTEDGAVGENGERSVRSITVDPSNPFSRAALLQRSYDNAKRGSTNSFAASGQLYAGSLQNAQDENARGFQQNDNALRQSFADFLLGKEGDRVRAVQAAREGDTGAFADLLSRQLATTPTDPGVKTEIKPVMATSTPDRRNPRDVKPVKGKKRRVVSNGWQQTGSQR